MTPRTNVTAESYSRVAGDACVHINARVHPDAIGELFQPYDTNMTGDVLGLVVIRLVNEALPDAKKRP